MNDDDDENLTEDTESGQEQAEATKDDDDFDFSDFDEPQIGDDDPNYQDSYTDYYGNEITLGEGYTDTEGNWHGYTDEETSTDDYGWEFKNPESVGYEGHTDKNGNWHDDILSLHNLGKRAEDAGHAVKGWIESTADKLNQTLGGARQGYTSADFERAEEASKAWNTYNQKAEQQQKSIDDFKSRMDPNSSKDQETLSKLQAEYDSLISSRDSINRDINSTDTGSRAKNVGNNILEDLGDAGTRINQFFGGSDQYGLSAHGDINDRNGDGKTSFSERLLNMGRDTREWALDRAQGLGKTAIGLAMAGLPGGVIWSPLTAELVDRGVSALRDYAKNHNYYPTEAELNAQREAEEQAMQDSNSDNDTETFTKQTSIPKPTVSQKENTPVAKNNWSELKLNAMANNGQKFGSMNRVNDTMGFKTSALSDAHFKDFVLAMMVDSDAMRNVVKTRLMMDYFNR